MPPGPGGPDSTPAVSLPDASVAPLVGDALPLVQRQVAGAPGPGAAGAPPAGDALPVVQRQPAADPPGRGAGAVQRLDEGVPVRIPAVRQELSAVAGAARDVQRVALVGDRGLGLRAAATPQEPETQSAATAVVPVVWTRPAQPSVQRLAEHGTPPQPGTSAASHAAGTAVPGLGDPGTRRPSAAGLPVQRLGFPGAGRALSAPDDGNASAQSRGSASPYPAGSPTSGLGAAGAQGPYAAGLPVQRLGASAQLGVSASPHRAGPPMDGPGAPGGEPGPYAAGLPVQRLELPGAGRRSGTAVAARDAGDLAVGAGIGTREPDGSIVFAPPATVQREPDAPAPAPAPGGEPGPAAQPAASPGAPPAAAPPPAAAGESTDELVRRLLAPLTRLLRAELRLDRERAGMRLDSRH
ncbi:hypothetical protein [Actinacidiphila bryophytorum]|uniref:hypothetical protein n=1 Tax=Actinacidiphila bryophytorum TaxID=1436133 RepID=UPI00195FA182|nr:hypothetical protein [Actinacidiphila bryophytorum]MBM9435059.1 hypothetical protein [Actinacidiphila bryophytorum]